MSVSSSECSFHSAFAENPPLDTPTVPNPFPPADGYGPSDPPAEIAHPPLQERQIAPKCPNYLIRFAEWQPVQSSLNTLIQWRSSHKARFVRVIMTEIALPFFIVAVAVDFMAKIALSALLLAPSLIQRIIYNTKFRENFSCALLRGAAISWRQLIGNISMLITNLNPHLSRIDSHVDKLDI